MSPSAARSPATLNRSSFGSLREEVEKEVHQTPPESNFSNRESAQEEEVVITM